MTGVTPATCANCGSSLQGVFCSECGQKNAPLNPSLRQVLSDFSDEALSLDGRVFRSLRLLITRPGFLTREHFAGRRIGYAAPFRLYLIASIVFFALTALAPPPDGIQVDFTPGPNDTPEEIAAARQRLPGLRQQAVATLLAWMPRAMFVLVPVFALLTAAVMRRSGRNYPQHLYFALHVHAAWFLLSAVGAAASIAVIPYVTRAVTGLVLPMCAVYMILAFRGAYGLRVTQSLWRAALVGLTYILIVGITLVSIMVPVILGD
jgi:hypothetical protein